MQILNCPLLYTPAGDRHRGQAICQRYGARESGASGGSNPQQYLGKENAGYWLKTRRHEWLSFQEQAVSL